MRYNNGSRSSALLVRVALALLALASIVAALGSFAEVRRDALWYVVRACVANNAVTGFAFPCLEVNTSIGEERGYVILRRPYGNRDIDLAPTKRVLGIEDHWLRMADAPSYFLDAWRARGFLGGGSGHGSIAHDDIALAVNSRLSRTQDQLHIHIGCISREARQAVRSSAAELSETAWTPLNTRIDGFELRGLKITQSSLNGINPFRLVEEGIAAEAGDLAPMGLFVAGNQFAEGRDGFVAFSWSDTPGRLLPAERFLDPSCGHRH
jgi:CDP-diacylglycerol pyrophosphatase